METLTVKGSPRKRGQMHGEHFKQAIHELFEIREQLLLQKLETLSREEMREKAREHLGPLKRVPDLHEEFMGISDAAGIDPIDLVLLNNYTDLRDFDPPKKASAREEGCSTFGIWASKTQIVGQTWDMHQSAEPFVFRLRVTGAGEPEPIEVFTIAGCLALAGVNSKGLGVFINNLHSKEPVIGLMWPAVVRGLLQKGSVDEAIDFMHAHPPSAGHNYLLTDPKGFRNIEASGARMKESGRLEERGSLYHTNHYLGELVAIENTARISPTTHARFHGMENYFESNLESSMVDTMTIERAGRDLCSRNCVANTCVIGTANDPHSGHTCGGLIFDTTTKAGVMFQGPYDDQRHVAFQL